MKFLFNKVTLFIVLSGLLLSQSFTPSRFALKSTLADSFITEGLTSNVVAEIKEQFLYILTH